MGTKDVSARWLKASRALKKEDQVYGERLAEMAKKHSSEAFYAMDDPLEAAVFSVLVEMKKAALVRIDCVRLKADPDGILKWMLTPAVAGD